MLEVLWKALWVFKRCIKNPINIVFYYICPRGKWKLRLTSPSILKSELLPQPLGPHIRTLTPDLTVKVISLTKTSPFGVTNGTCLNLNMTKHSYTNRNNTYRVSPEDTLGQLIELLRIYNTMVQFTLIIGGRRSAGAGDRFTKKQLACWTKRLRAPDYGSGVSDQQSVLESQSSGHDTCVLKVTWK